jgi:hypothetical protein
MSDEEDSGLEHDSDEAAYRAAGPRDILPANFSQLVLSVSASALMHMNEGPDADAQAQPDLTLARHSIDLLGMLEEKTRGNLTGDEERLLHQVLFDLRMRFTRKAAAR